MSIQSWWNADVKKIVITGSLWCHDVDTSIAQLTKIFENRWVNVITVSGSVACILDGRNTAMEGLQEKIISEQLYKEELASKMAGIYQERTLILLNWWLTDIKSCIPPEMTEQYSLRTHIKNAGYDEIIPIMPSPETWSSSTMDFTENLRKIEWIISNTLGIPQPIEMKSRYIVEIINHEQLAQIAKQIEIEQVYLWVGDDMEQLHTRTIQWTKHAYCTCYHIFKDTDKKQKSERIISKSEYNDRKWELATILSKTHWCFMYENQYFTLDIFDDNSASCQWLLEIERMHADQKVTLPPFLKEIANVTQDTLCFG